MSETVPTINRQQYHVREVVFRLPSNYVIQKNHEWYVITPLAIEEYEEMQETIELLQDVQKSVSQIKDGKGIEHDKAKKHVLGRLRS